MPVALQVRCKPRVRGRSRAHLLKYLAVDKEELEDELEKEELEEDELEEKESVTFRFPELFSILASHAASIGKDVFEGNSLVAGASGGVVTGVWTGAGSSTVTFKLNLDFLVTSPDMLVGVLSKSPASVLSPCCIHLGTTSFMNGSTKAESMFSIVLFAFSIIPSD